MCLQNIESRLKVLLPDDVGAALMDGVVLCHLANLICPRSVASIHVPSPAVVRANHEANAIELLIMREVAFRCFWHIRLSCMSFLTWSSAFQPKLSMAKCRRNVENFLDACKKLGVPQVMISLTHYSIVPTKYHSTSYVCAKWLYYRTVQLQYCSELCFQVQVVVCFTRSQRLAQTESIMGRSSKKDAFIQISFKNLVDVLSMYLQVAHLQWVHAFGIYPNKTWH